MEEVKLPYCDIIFKEHYAILRVHEGAQTTLETAKEIRDIVEKFYGNRYFVMITHREHFYNIDLDIYKWKIPKKIRGLAIVSEIPQEFKRALGEQEMFDHPFAFFDDLKDAEEWAMGFF